MRKLMDGEIPVFLLPFYEAGSLWRLAVKDSEPSSQGVCFYDSKESYGSYFLKDLIIEFDTTWVKAFQFSRSISRKGSSKKVFSHGVFALQYVEDFFRKRISMSNRIEHPIIGEYKMWKNGEDVLRRVDLYCRTSSGDGAFFEAFGVRVGQFRSLDKFPHEHLKEVYSEITGKNKNSGRN